MTVNQRAAFIAGLADDIAAEQRAEAATRLAALQVASAHPSRAVVEAGQLRDIRELQARAQVARSRLTLDPDAGPGDARELLAAREALRQARGVYGPTDTGFDDSGLHALVWLEQGYGASEGAAIQALINVLTTIATGGGPVGIVPGPVAAPGSAMPLSGLRR